MLFFMSKITSEVGGTLVLKATPDSAPYDNAARINRAKTLDGSSAFSHYGVTDTDRDLEIGGYLSASEEAKLREFHAESQPLRFSFADGASPAAHLGYIYKLTIERGRKMVATLYLIQKLSN